MFGKPRNWERDQGGVTLEDWKELVLLKNPRFRKYIFYISINTGQNCMVSEADNPKNDSNMSILCDVWTEIW